MHVVLLGQVLVCKGHLGCKEIWYGRIFSTNSTLEVVLEGREGVGGYVCMKYDCYSLIKIDPFKRRIRQ